jgi:hypothetical protein
VGVGAREEGGEGRRRRGGGRCEGGWGEGRGRRGVRGEGGGFFSPSYFFRFFA